MKHCLAMLLVLAMALSLTACGSRAATDPTPPAPMAVLTFAEEYDFSGKTIVPFVTHGTSGIGAVVRDLTAALPDDVTILDEIGVYRPEVDASQSAVQDWAAGLELKR